MAHSAWIGYEIDVIDTLRFNNDANLLYRLATPLGMRPNQEYWWSTKQPQVTDLRCSWASRLGSQWHRRGIELVSKSLVTSHCFTKRLFHNANIFCCYICICCLKLHQADYKVKDFFSPRFVRGAVSSNVFTICAVYWSLGRRAYLGVSNVVLVVSVTLVSFPCAILIKCT